MSSLAKRAFQKVVPPPSIRARIFIRGIMPVVFQAASQALPQKEFVRRLPMLRTTLDQLTKVTPLASGTFVEREMANGVPVDLLRQADLPTDSAIMFFHGGGYIILNSEWYRPFCSHLAQATKTQVFSVDYRLAPEHRFPAAVEDTTKAYKWVLEKQGISPDRIVFGGDSAGGGLTITTLLNLKKVGMPMPRAAFCISPWTDLTCSGKSHIENAGTEVMLPPALIPVAAEVYSGKHSKKNPLISPLFASPAELQGLPPLLITCGQPEVLRDDGIMFAKVAQGAGLDVTLKIYDHMCHIFQCFTPFFPESQQGTADLAAFIVKHLGGGASVPAAAAAAKAAPKGGKK